MLRLATPTDAQAIHTIYAPLVAETAISFETAVPDQSQIRTRIEKTLARYPWIVFEDGGHVLGYAYSGAHRVRLAYDWSVDVSVYVAPEARRRQIGRRVYLALFELLAVQGFVSVFAGIALPNAASVGLHEAVGFTPVGVYRNAGYKLGEWRDVGWWQRPLADPPNPPQPPIALPVLLARRPDLVGAVLARGG